jgi:bacteriocin biosynthesis cyclodehydratase domain-containing protein
VEGQLGSEESAPPGGGALHFRLCQSVELFVSRAGDLYLLRTGGEPGAVIRDPSPGDRALLERAVAGLDAAPGSPEAERLAPLVGAGFVRAGPPSAPLAPRLAERFDRQLPYLAQLGDPTELQERLGAAQVAVLGCGGLGTWALAAIASTGVGRFVIVDDDTVELANLNRQVIYSEADVGTAKVTAAARWLRAFDPAIAVSAHECAVEGVADAAELVAGSDLVILAADWPPYALGRWVNEACVGLGVPFITAGQQPPLLKVGPTFVPGAGPCFACHELEVADGFPLYPELAAYRQAHPTRATTLGPASGVAGTLLGLEAMHLLLGAEPATLGRALLIDMRTLATRWEPCSRHPACPVCASATD